MLRVIRRRSKGEKKDVQYNHYGQAIGDSAAEYVTYIGVLARAIPINYKNWKEVAGDLKEKLWDYVQALSLLLLSAYYKFLGGFPLTVVASLLLYVGCYQISFGPISWLMVSEIFPLHMRGIGISLAVLTNFGSNAIVTFAFSPLKFSEKETYTQDEIDEIRSEWAKYIA